MEDGSVFIREGDTHEEQGIWKSRLRGIINLINYKRKIWKVFIYFFKKIMLVFLNLTYNVRMDFIFYNNNEWMNKKSNGVKRGEHGAYPLT